MASAPVSNSDRLRSARQGATAILGCWDGERPMACGFAGVWDGAYRLEGEALARATMPAQA
jgi:hypothetical protein